MTLHAGIAFTGSGFAATGDGGHGIDATGGAELVLADVALVGSHGSGLEQIGGTLSATRVIADGNESAGIRALDLTRAMIDASSATSNAQGIALGTSGGELTIINSVVRENGSFAPSAGGGIAITATDGATVSLSAVTMDANRAFYGAGLRIEELTGASTMLVENSIVTRNTASGAGGGVASADSPFVSSIGGSSHLRIARTLIEGNSAADTGGGLAIPTIESGSSVTVAESTIRSNAAALAAGAVVSYIEAGTNPGFTLDASTVSGNIAELAAGGLLLECAEGPGVAIAEVVNSTISGNSASTIASGLAAGCDVENALSVNLSHTTVTANAGDADTAVLFARVTADVRNSIIGDNSNRTDLSAQSSPLDVAYSLIERPDPAVTAAADAGSGNITGAAPELEPLAANGGETQTHLPIRNGNLTDAGDPAFAYPPEHDQRGAPRVVDRLDLGSVELGASVPPVPPSDPSAPVLPATGPTSGASTLAFGIAVALLGATIFFLRTARQRGEVKFLPRS
jgi:LPXTG-motif cell wall-anchored protein